ncbi:NADPH:quinone oxidoreductase family protein [Novosphingobium sp. 9U]|uniref:NADPH:quinone oxidoreductase family protein n=1 Tax=Novosphingobium sp. 9U TaxID=2653158 RepID=UPI0012F09D9B|nr:NADPH:quinone oxidoreductase family protein [Novosphingobium sp. 9U]VWX50290.1 Oxidoreductase, zinc-binding dehydrogenase family [Novosphingobium sp. 9U]
MKALVSQASGGPETLELIELPDPQPGLGEVRIAVAACGINYPDVLVIEDRYQSRPIRPFAPGAEVSGVIDAIGPGVTGLAVGDRVASGTPFGGLAQKALAPAENCYRLPDSVPFDVGAGMLVTYGTSHHALKDQARLQAGETLLVLGAAGGVGLAAVELGKAWGARVIGAVSSEAKAEIVRVHGADEVIVYPPDGLNDRAAAKAFTDKIKALSNGGVNVVYDSVGGSYAEPALRAVAWAGRYLVVGFPAGIPSIPLNLTLLKGSSIVGVFWGAFTAQFPELNRRNIAELFGMMAAGSISPLVSARFPLEQGGEAIAMLADRLAIGKVVVTVD